nr:hypothetical protein [Tanacetum cinerariifolium]
MLPVTQIGTFYNGLTLRHLDTINAAACGTFMKSCPEECYDLIENITAHHNDWDTSIQRSESSSSITSSSDPEIVALKAKMAENNKNLMKAKLRTYILWEPIIKVVILNNLKMNTALSSGSRTLLSNTVTNPKEDLKVERETEVKKDTVPPTNNGSTKDVQLSVVQIENQIPNSEPIVSPIVEPVAPVSAPKPNPKPLIPYPFTDALILMPKFGPTIKSLLTNKEKLFELARTSLNEHCSTVLIKKLQEKLGDPGKLLIPCDFLGMDECLALVDLGASINLMPLSVWNKLSLPKPSLTCMTLELVDFLISRPVGVTEDVFIKVGTFHFPADFVVVNFYAYPRVPLILERSFLKTERALIDVYEGELTLRVGKEAVTFNLDPTSRYSANYDAILVNRINLIDVAYEEYSQEVLGFSMSGNPTPSKEPIVSTSSPTVTPFRDNILLLEEFLNDDPSSLPIPPQKLKVVEPKDEKYSIDEPPVVKLKDIPPHLEYAFLEVGHKLPIIIAKDLKDEEKTALIKVLKLHKQALAWQLSDIKGVNLEFVHTRF